MKRTTKRTKAGADSARERGETPSLSFPLDGVFLKSATFRELEIEAPPPPSPSGRVDLNLETSLTVRMYVQGAELQLALKVKPNTTYIPVEVEVAMSLYIRRTEGATDKELATFAAHSGIGILFPYVREYVHSVTSRGRFASILIDMNDMNKMLNDAIEAQSRRLG